MTKGIGTPTTASGQQPPPVKLKIDAAPKVKTVRPARTDDTHALDRLDLKLGFLLHDVSRLRRKAFDQLMRPLGVTRAQWWVLAHLSKHDGMMQTQLAAMLEVGKASLGTIVERLESAGFVERRPDPIDKRAKRIYLARNAHHLLEKVAELERSFNNQIMQNLDSQEREQLARSLTTVKQALSGMDLGESSADMDDETP